MAVSLRTDDTLKEGDVVEFFIYYSASMLGYAAMASGPSSEEISGALASLAEITVINISNDIIRRVAGPTQVEWRVRTTFHGIPWSVGQLQGDIYNAMSALLGDSWGAAGDVTVGPFSEIQGQIVTTNPDPEAQQGSTESWGCTILGLGCSSTVGQITSTVKWLAVAVVVVAAVYFLKGANVGVHAS